MYSCPVGNQSSGLCEMGLVGAVIEIKRIHKRRKSFMNSDNASMELAIKLLVNLSTKCIYIQYVKYENKEHLIVPETLDMVATCSSARH